VIDTKLLQNRWRQETRGEGTPENGAKLLVHTADTNLLKVEVWAEKLGLLPVEKKKKFQVGVMSGPVAQHPHRDEACSSYSLLDETSTRHLPSSLSTFEGHDSSLGGGHELKVGLLRKQTPVASGSLGFDGSSKLGQVDWHEAVDGELQKVVRAGLVQDGLPDREHTTNLALIPQCKRSKQPTSFTSQDTRD
jgi:hypothetical protein